MTRRPRGSTRTDTRVPYPALFRSYRQFAFHGDMDARRAGGRHLRIIVGRDRAQMVNAPPPGVEEIAIRGRIAPGPDQLDHHVAARSEEHTSELQSLMRISYAAFCWKKKQIPKDHSLLNLHIP